MDISGTIAIAETEHQIQAKLFGMNDIVEDEDSGGQTKDKGRPTPPIVKFCGDFAQSVLVIGKERKDGESA